jgi:hypothetical protein
VAAKIEIHCGELAQGLRQSALIRGVDVYGDVYGAEEAFAGGANFYRAAESGIVSHAFNFCVRKPHQLHFVRGEWLAIMFMVGGGLGGSPDAGSSVKVPVGTVWISGSPRMVAHLDPSPRLLAGCKVWIERQRLVEVFGLQVDNIPELYRPIFTTARTGTWRSSCRCPLQPGRRCGKSCNAATPSL